MRFLLALALFLAPVVALAEAALPKSVLSRIKRDPVAYVEDLVVLIEGFGQGGAIDRQGLETVVALSRAQARALALRRLQGADLDGDGAIAAAELAVAAAAASAVARGRLKLHFASADADGDGQVTAGELQAYARAVALEAFSPDKAREILAILQFDGDGDGWVTRAEGEAAVAALALSLGQTRGLQNRAPAGGRVEPGDGPGRRPLAMGRDPQGGPGAI